MAGGGGVHAMGMGSLMDTEFQFYKMKKFWTLVIVIYIYIFKNYLMILKMHI